MAVTRAFSRARRHRGERITVPPCPDCGSDRTYVVSREGGADALWRCARCCRTFVWWFPFTKAEWAAVNGAVNEGDMSVNEVRTYD